ncbi:MAG: cellulase family glycosylhydrolase [Oscillospiraceae bacterium]|nr:cellulase family glycosylhydrolase [Oscillospiraceae bacterium]
MKQTSFFKKAIAAVMSAAMLFTAAIPVSAAKSFETAESAVDSINAGWNLGNALDSCGEWIGLYTDGKPASYETAWGNPVTTKKLITTVKNAGFNAIRVPVTWAEHIDSNGNIDKEWLDRVQEVVDYVISQDLYCVLNVHHDAGADGWLEASSSCYKNNSKKFAGLWKNIAVRFKDYDEKLIFESFNEILDSKNSWGDAKTNDAYKAVNDFNQLFVDTVRKTGGNNAERNLMVQVYSGSCSEKALAGFELPTDTVKNHLIIHAHNYDPQGFTATDATWTTMTDKWGTDAEKVYFDKLFARLGKFTEKQVAPMVIGEFGANFKDNNDSRKVYASYFVTTAAKYGIKCFWWDTGDMALFDRNKCTVKHSEVVKALTQYSGKKTTVTASTKKTEEADRPVVTAKKGANKVTLKWTAVDDADAYRVYQYNPATKKYTRIKTVKGTSCTIKNLESGSYKFIVCAARKNGKSYKKIGENSKSAKVSVS